MQESYVGIKELWQEGNDTLAISWSDGRLSLYNVVDLRRRCPCAHCLDEWTRKPILDPESIDASVRPVRIDSVGLYALKITFSDKHSTGIYTYDFLRQLDANQKVRNPVGSVAQEDHAKP